MTGMSSFAGGGEREHAAGHLLPEPGPMPRVASSRAVLASAAVAGGCLACTVAMLSAGAPPAADKAAMIGLAGGAALLLACVIAVVRAAALQAGEHAEQTRELAERGQAEMRQMTDRASIFVNLAGRMQSLTHRAIGSLDEVELEVENPDLLKRLYGVDHQVTQIRRLAESLAVLGGSASRRQWSRPVRMQEVLRAAVSEIEHYNRVKVLPPVEGVLIAPVVADLVHLIAELVENATKFSDAQVQLRAQEIPAGVVVEVEDRGIGMGRADRGHMNDLLADPGRVGVDALGDGRIGIGVVAVLAGRHRVRVVLQDNVYGAVTAAVIIPPQLLERGDAEPPARAAAEHAPVPSLTVTRAEQIPALLRQPPGPAVPARAAAAAPWELPAQEPEQPRLPQRRRPDPGRPPLPSRNPGAGLAPQLREGREDGTGSRPRALSRDQDPGFAADFLDGFSSPGAGDRAGRD